MCWILGTAKFAVEFHQLRFFLAADCLEVGTIKNTF